MASFKLSGMLQVQSDNNVTTTAADASGVNNDSIRSVSPTPDAPPPGEAPVLAAADPVVAAPAADVAALVPAVAGLSIAVAAPAADVATLVPDVAGLVIGTATPAADLAAIVPGIADLSLVAASGPDVVADPASEVVVAPVLPDLPFSPPSPLSAPGDPVPPAADGNVFGAPAPTMVIPFPVQGPMTEMDVIAQQQRALRKLWESRERAKQRQQEVRFFRQKDQASVTVFVEKLSPEEIKAIGIERKKAKKKARKKAAKLERRKVVTSQPKNSLA